MTRWSLLLAAVSVLVLFVARGALAVPPAHHTDSDDYGGSTSCSGFDDVYEGHIDASGITTFDKAGNPV